MRISTVSILQILILEIFFLNFFINTAPTIIRYTHPPSSPLTIALPSATHLFSLKSLRYSGNWRLQQTSVPRPSHDLWKKQRFFTFVTFDLQKSQFKVISRKAIQTLNQIGLYPNKKLHKLHQPHFFTLTIATSGANLSQENLVSTPPSAMPVLVIKRSRLPPAPNINQPLTPITTFVCKQCKKPLVTNSNHQSSLLQLPAFEGKPIMMTRQADQACQQ
jgi:hypothetical protein